jgi:predicted ArsR family transcriptional regulator
VGNDLDTRLDQVATLGEPVRRALYRFVAAQPEPVTREQAAGGVGVGHHTAQVHLDRLVDGRLLEAGYRRPPGRGGPGAGRPAKVYRRSAADLDVSLPERRYDLAGRLLVKAVAQAERTGSPVPEALRSVAAEAGRSAGTQAAPDLFDALAADGYQPRRDGDGITLANCPFHALAREATELVCGMNRAYLEGVLRGIGETGLAARLDPAPGRCCVRLQRRVTP